MDNIHNSESSLDCNCTYFSDVKGCLLFKYINLEDTNIIDIENCPYIDKNSKISQDNN